MTFEGLDIRILGPACLAGLIVLSTHVPLGKQVLSRGIIFIDLAIAQIAALGVILSQFFDVDTFLVQHVSAGLQGYGVQIVAVAAALARVPGAADRNAIRAGRHRQPAGGVAQPGR